MWERWRSMLPTLRHIAPQPAQKGAYAQAIGASRGGRTSKLHGLTDERGRPRILLISAGDINDMTMASALATGLPLFRLLPPTGSEKWPLSVGTGTFKGSTLLKKLKHGNYAAVPAELAKWNKTTIDGKKGGEQRSRQSTGGRDRALGPRAVLFSRVAGPPSSKARRGSRKTPLPSTLPLSLGACSSCRPPARLPALAAILVAAACVLLRSYIQKRREA